jgi:succinate dehydrogenase/fumarate reductase flavoprotein subunit
MEEFTSRYGSDEADKYVLTRDLATYAILKEVEAGRGSPHGGAYLSFQHCSAAQLRAAFGPVIDRLAANRIDLTEMPVEVAPIAHYHMGGVVADARMQTPVPGLLVAGEAVGGANGANRLSGNAVTEALVFGRRAGRSAAARAKAMASRPVGSNGVAPDWLKGDPSRRRDLNTAEMVQELQRTMWNQVGPYRTEEKLAQTLTHIGEMTRALGDLPPAGAQAFDLARLEWLDLRNMLLVARVVTQAALQRTESRGAHQREDFPEQCTEWGANQVVHLRGGDIEISRSAVVAAEAAQ